MEIPCHSSKTSKKLLVSGVFVAPLLGREITEAELAFVAQRLVDELDPIQICQARFLPQLLSKDLPRLEHRIVSMACPEPESVTAATSDVSNDCQSLPSALAV